MEFATVQAFVVYDGKVLMQQRDENDRNPHKWSLVGGGREPGESAEQTLLRELDEEICIKPSNYKFLLSRPSLHHPGEQVMVYYVRLTQEEAAEVRIGNEGLQLKFVPLEEISEMDLVPSLKKYYDENKETVDSLLKKLLAT